MTPDGSKLYVVNDISGSVSVFNTTTMAPISTIPVLGSLPSSMGQFIAPGAAPTPTPVPTMSEWAMILLGGILAAGAALSIHRRRLAA